ncbi:MULTISPECIES: low temperature requirement protein A [Streptomyces]|uniref:low temperature requirement protein A n=1 Tax=Streptomyces TaxID=1883 RepID=UPI0013684E47|nr:MULTISPECIES: low temperature requirement protein A [Streptomyces]MCX4717011.1 low temperature requirement protein A [Streptomyces virginiae]MCX5274767.1 low temperature requirement protein A [Streptomyces virginiae]MYV77064.1 low temperature requirement protein A [Streptomyces sp. SID1046]
MESEHRVSTLELFFDLVFVFTITQLTVLLADDLTPRGAGQVVLIFTVLFWMYGGYAHLTNQVPPDRTVRRVLLMLAMGAFLVCALAVPTAFGAGGIAFGLGYLLVVLVHGALFTQAHGRGVLWFALPNVLCALSVTAAGFFDGLPAWGLWMLALLLQFVTPVVVQRVAASGAAEPEAPEVAETVEGPGQTVGDQLGGMNAAHLVERHGLLLIIVFGESVIAIGIGVGSLPLSLGIAGGAFLALTIASAMWWMYFVRDEGRAEEVFERTPAERRFKLAMVAYYYAFLPMLLGIAVFAAGVKKTIGHLGEHLHTGPAVALAGGVALYLAGDLAFRAALGIGPARYRAAALVLALATVPVGTSWTGAGQLVALACVLVGALAAEGRRSPAEPAEEAAATEAVTGSG